MADDLEERLRSHARAFEGLMSILPAETYYGKDDSITSTQWQQKKQSKAEKRAAKKARLDPASHKTAMDVLDEAARKRKREEEGEDSSSIDLDIEMEKPYEGLKRKKPKTTKENEKPAKEGKSPNAAQSEPQSARAKAKAEKRQQKREKRKEKMAQKKLKEQNKSALQNEFSTSLHDKEEAEDEAEEDEAEEADEATFDHQDGERINALDVSGLVEDTATPSSAQSNASTGSVVSAASSMSSTAPGIADDSSAEKEKEKESKFRYDPEKHNEYRARLHAKLEALRAARKADGPDGRPAKNRAELIEARRRKEAERKAARKANRQLAKDEEERLKAEEQLARIRGGSGSPSIFPRATPEQEPNLAFAKVAWKDGKQMDEKLSGFLDPRKKKGKSDVKTALEAAEKKRARLSALDEAKRKDIEEKDAWLNAKKRAQGEKVHDDPALLRKSVKRLEKQKAKSKQEWKDRLTSVQKSQEARQKKREANLKKRKEEKGNKGSKGKGKKPAKKVKKRPGFEGTFKAR
ncbi:SURF6-domain-containing protein [Westerdykella ornata]|uniref:SURF6-domain-containing protein n=1 Tax=Westerdykella ornata TaxID=318751 RepID=A0A6A6JFG8_WESOR|nr:SURF6-domain-containing protein [Westerdykella ornata]KAF2273929.1 SURF6-domain-containing protein [Westerdykella ornata]